MYVPNISKLANINETDMKTIIFTLGLLSFLIAPISAKAIEDIRGEPQPEVWIMSIEICRDLPPGLQDAIDRGIIYQHWLIQQCKWFAVGASDIIQDNNELKIWPTYQDCMDSNINVAEGFTLRKQFCQSIKEYDPDNQRRRD